MGSETTGLGAVFDALTRSQEEARSFMKEAHQLRDGKIRATNESISLARENAKLKNDIVLFNDKCVKIRRKLEAENAKLREVLQAIEFCAEAHGDHWCPLCRGNKQEGTTTRGHYQHCPIYAALKEPDDAQDATS